MKKDHRLKEPYDATDDNPNDASSPDKRINFGWKHACVFFGLTFLIVAVLLVTKYWPLWEQELIPQQLLTKVTPLPNASSIPDTTAPDASTSSEEKSGEASQPMPTVLIDDWNYVDDDIEIHVEPVSSDDVLFYVADIKLKDISFFRTAFAEDQFGNFHEDTSSMAKRKNAILAINGDYCGFDNRGIIIRDGELYRNKPVQEMAALYKDGRMEVMAEEGVDPDELLKSDVLHTWSFGPWLIKYGEARTDFSFSKLKQNNPRAGIGMIVPLHYIFIVVDGRSDESRGMKLSEFAQEFAKRGCNAAYNLDGGGSATLYFNGRVVNRPLGTTNERSISDILYIGK